MFLEPDTEIRYYYQDGTPMDASLVEAIHAGDILIKESAFRYFRHPESPHEYVKIDKGDYKADWQEQAAEFTPEFVRAILELSVRKRAELDTIKKVHLEEQVREQLQKQKWTFDVFFSYSSLDTEPATVVRNKVIAAGGRIFMAREEIRPGDNFEETIRNALVYCEELWLLFSPSSMKSEWVITEWGIAWALKKKIVPILYQCDHSALPGRLRGTHTVDFNPIDELIAKRFPSNHKK
jgi:hypothetical protein